MLIPEMFFQNVTSLSKIEAMPSQNILNFLIEYTQDTGHLFMNLTELETFTGLSSRMLQLSFQKTLNITPSQWIKKQKMLHAHRLIVEGKGFITITQIALECGFTNFSLFAKYYREEFKELPSQTMKKISRF